MHFSQLLLGRGLLVRQGFSSLGRLIFLVLLVVVRPVFQIISFRSRCFSLKETSLLLLVLLRARRALRFISRLILSLPNSLRLVLAELGLSLGYTETLLLEHLEVVSLDIRSVSQRLFDLVQLCLVPVLGVSGPSTVE